MPLRQTALVPALAADLCLGYANTLSWRGSDPPSETLNGLGDLLAWLDRSAGTGPRTTQEIASWARRHEKQAAKLFAQAIALREALFRIFRALAAGEPLRDQDFAALGDALARAPARRQLARTETGYGWLLDPPKPAILSLLAPVLWSAADLLIAGDRQRVRLCANGKCLWLFLDESKNGTRRWCAMASCGNRAKARRHYLKRSRVNC
jgi:predicted RNA-binding Zn ribbon-like protein